MPQSTIERALVSILTRGVRPAAIDPHYASALRWACVSSVDTWILGTIILGKEFTMTKTHPPYPHAFRAEAVELARTSGKGLPQLAHDLGVSSVLVSR